MCPSDRLILLMAKWMHQECKAFIAGWKEWKNLRLVDRNHYQDMARAILRRPPPQLVRWIQKNAK